MKNTISIIFIILALMLILDSMNIGHMVAMFLLAGIIPGTNLVLNAERMLELFALLIGFVLARVAVALTRTYATYRSEKLHNAKNIA